MRQVERQFGLARGAAADADDGVIQAAQVSVDQLLAAMLAGEPRRRQKPKPPTPVQPTSSAGPAEATPIPIVSAESGVHPALAHLDALEAAASEMYQSLLSSRDPADATAGADNLPVLEILGSHRRGRAALGAGEGHRVRSHGPAPPPGRACRSTKPAQSKHQGEQDHEKGVVTMETEPTMPVSMAGDIPMTDEEHYNSVAMPADIVAEHMLALEHGEPDDPLTDSRPEHIVAPWQKVRLTRRAISRFKQVQRDRRSRQRARALLTSGRRSSRSRSACSRGRRTAGATTARSADPPPQPSRFRRASPGGAR